MTSEEYAPTPGDKFSFGIWTVGWQGVDVFGGAVRPPMAADRAVRQLAELGAYGVNFHDNDLFPFDAPDPERDARIASFRRALDETGLVVTTATTNLFGHPMRNYLILREKVTAFRADPEVQAALAASGVADLAIPTLAAGETWRDVQGFTPDIATLGARGLAYEHLDQLALEHLYGVR